MFSSNKSVNFSSKPLIKKKKEKETQGLLSPSSPTEGGHMELRVRSHSEGGAVKWLLTPPEINCSLWCQRPQYCKEM